MKCLLALAQDRFKSARVLTAGMRNLHGMRAGRKTIHNRLLSRGCHAYRPTRKLLLTANYGSAEGPPRGVENRNLLSHPDDLRMEAYVIRMT